MEFTVTGLLVDSINMCVISHYIIKRQFTCRCGQQEMCFLRVVHQDENKSSETAPDVTSVDKANVWSMNRLNIRSEHLDFLNVMYGQTHRQVQKDFLEDLHCLLNIERQTEFLEHVLVINVTEHYVEYQEKVMKRFNEETPLKGFAG